MYLARLTKPGTILSNDVCLQISYLLLAVYNDPPQGPVSGLLTA